jgi:hypothetical protein
MSRPDDSFERRFALEQAVKFAATDKAKFTADVPSMVVIAIADRFLNFLKDESK